MPVVTKTLVCLANSRRPMGRCVAGIELIEGGRAGWVRPISARDTHEVSEYERQYSDGSDPKVLDIMTVPLVAASPTDFQTENWVLEASEYWQKKGVVDWTDLALLADDTPVLWLNDSSTIPGLNDQVAAEFAQHLDYSLTLVHVDSLTLRTLTPGAAYGNHKRRLQGEFHLNGVHYLLWITDPVYERVYHDMADDDVRLGECYLTISLAESHNGYCSKLIAAVIERDDSEGLR